ncbi:probable BOI-related E3 ubiquitin-protein ligase 2 isoform X2 [Impatiens glandulifera]|uniref:probable BOI-related E3 ubiquitin-protein ligase 2 isoform X2 n=1 Tax=Impatiens glandulifera TaxID=253017 RepID=UPI001FB14148|nr:probable BOI-related E3 ubiquitin-protein ligase 2 isoform X2 [Impatiens glandulifera]
MAVQAQYPSNVLLQLNRNGNVNAQPGINPLGNECSSQQPHQGGGGIRDQSDMIFDNRETNPRKRGREIFQTGFGQTQFIDRPNVSTGLRLGEQQLLQQQQQQQHSRSSTLSNDITAQIRQHNQEIDNFLQAQREQLRRAIEEKNRRYNMYLLAAAEEAVAKRLREKEVESEKAIRRNAELEATAVRLIAEVHTWQARARAQEAAAASLQVQLEQAMMVTRGEESGGPAAEDAESCYVDPDRVLVSPATAAAAAASEPRCRACGERGASVVNLPCRHLCLCRECDSAVQSCPVCFSFRKSSVEVFFC